MSHTASIIQIIYEHDSEHCLSCSFNCARQDSRLISADLKKVLAPRFFRSVVRAVQSIAGYDGETHTYESPSLAVRVGHDLRRCSQLLRSAAIEEEDTITAENAQHFNELCASEWNDDVAGSAWRVLQNRKIGRPLLLPLAADREVKSSIFGFSADGATMVSYVPKRRKAVVLLPHSIRTTPSCQMTAENPK